jgi:alpha-N-arabinofuranosidase
MDKDGKIHISIANLNPSKEISLTCPVIGGDFRKATGEVLTASDMTAHNSFEAPEVVKPTVFDDFKMKDGVLSINMPAKSVVVLELE